MVDRPLVDRPLVDRPLVDRPLVDRPLVDRPLLSVDGDGGVQSAPTASDTHLHRQRGNLLNYIINTCVPDVCFVLRSQCLNFFLLLQLFQNG